MLLSAYQALYYMWNSYWNKPIPVDHRDLRITSGSDGIVHCDYINDGVYFDITKEDYDLIRPEISEKEFNHFDEMCPFDAEEPYRIQVINLSKVLEKGLITLNEFTEMVNDFNEKAGSAFELFYVQKEDWKNLGTCCPNCK